MANANVELKRIEFILKEEETICNVLYTSDEPGTPWGGGWKTRTFEKEDSVEDIVTHYVKDFLTWEDGKNDDEAVNGGSVTQLG